MRYLHANDAHHSETIYKPRTGSMLHRFPLYIHIKRAFRRDDDAAHTSCEPKCAYVGADDNDDDERHAAARSREMKWQAGGNASRFTFDPVPGNEP